MDLQITPSWLQLMANYNAWQNENLYHAADGLEDEDRREARGAFWRSMHETFCHILWADQQWLSRLTDDVSPPTAGLKQSGSIVSGWEQLKRQREQMDRQLETWAAEVQADELMGDLRWHSGATGKELVKSKALCICQLFNHQTHHRGQVHTMLTQAGAKPGDTDMPFMPEGWVPTGI
ncbi:MAG: DinB family protein [Pseudomonadota bacterium]